MSRSQSALFEYAHYHGMLSDRVRLEAYRAAIQATVKPGDVVVDLGAGTGILGLWALQAGASKVYAIEESNAIDLAVEIAKANGLDGQIEFINDNSMNVTLPEKANVLVSETLGSFGIDENTLAFTGDARDRFLEAGGALIPRWLDLYAAPFDDAGIYDKIDFWRHIPGIDFAPAFDVFSRKLMVEEVGADSLLGLPSAIAAIDLTAPLETVFERRLYMQIDRPGTIHGVAGWFRATLADGVDIITSPRDPSTHWKQAVLPFREPIDVIKGDVLDWSMRLEAKGPQSDDTQISYDYCCTQMKNELNLESTGRNDPCPCGSGRKFKKCCGS